MRRDCPRLPADMNGLIAGNHDPTMPTWLGGQVADEVRLGRLCFRHEAEEGLTVGEVSGHFHPKARVKSRGHAILSMFCD